MNKIKNICLSLYQRDIIFYGVLIFLIILIGQLPILLHFLHRPIGYYYPLIDRGAFDEYFYHSIIRYGTGPSWLVKVPFVYKEHQPSLLLIYYLWLGKISKLINFGPAEIYALARVLGGILYTLSVVLFMKLILKGNARIGFIFYLLSQPLPFYLNGQIFNQYYDKWVWFFGEAARRISIVPPHHIFGKGLTILSLDLLIIYFRSYNVIFLLVASILIFLTGIIYTPPVFIILIAFILSGVFYLLLNKENVRFILRPKIGIGIILFLGSCLISMAIIQKELVKGSLWWFFWRVSNLGWNDPSMQVEWNYLHMMGILLVFIPLALPVLWHKKRHVFHWYFIIFWTISAFLLFPFADILKLGKFRFTEGTQIVPLAALSTVGFNWISSFAIIISKKGAIIFKTAFFCLFILIFFLFTFFVQRNSTLALWPYWDNTYFKPKDLEALNYLQKNVRDSSLILAEYYKSNYIPVFARVRIILGSPGFYPDPAEEKYDGDMINKILDGSLSKDEASSYVYKRRVDFIYKEISLTESKEYYPDLLETVFNNGLINIYKIKK